MKKLEESRHGHVVLNQTDPFRMHSYKMKYVRNNSAIFTGKNIETDYANYYLGNDPSKWVSKASVSKNIDIKNAP